MLYGKTKVSFPHKVNELPETPFYAILKQVSIHIPGDQESIDRPGHGYPATTEDHWDIEVYENFEDWKNEIEDLTTRNDKKFKPVMISPAIVNTNINIEIITQSIKNGEIN